METKSSRRGKKQIEEQFNLQEIFIEEAKYREVKQESKLDGKPETKASQPSQIPKPSWGHQFVMHKGQVYLLGGYQDKPALKSSIPIYKVELGEKTGA